MFYDSCPDNLNAVPGKGEIPASRVLVASAPSPHRPRPNDPVGGKTVELVRAGAGAHHLYFTNLKKEPHPLGKKIPIKEVKIWAPILFDELATVLDHKKSPRILALGAEVATLLCPGFKNMREDRGTVFVNPELQCEVIPTYHFSMIFRDPTKKEVILHDLERFFAEGFEDRAEWIEGKFPEGQDRYLYLDIETGGDEPLEPQKGVITMIGMALGDSRQVSIFKPPFDWDKLFNYAKTKTLVGHNLQFDLAYLEYHSQRPWTTIKVEDTMLAAHILGNEVLSLKHLTTMHTKRIGSRGAGGVADEPYLAEDVLSTKDLHVDIFGKRARGQWISKLLYDLVPRTARMRLYGVNIDWEYERVLEEQYGTKLAELKTALEEIADINWQSNQQVAGVLRDNNVPLSVKTATGQFSVAEPVLQEFRSGYAIVDSLLTYRDVAKEAGLFLEYKNLAWDDLLLHPKLHLTGARTGRLSMSEPNLQQVPRLGPIKKLFTSRFKKGMIGLVDLAQAELRVAALLSSDEVMVEALLSEDVHRLIASMVYEKPPEEITAFQRKKSKGITFGLLYGGGAEGLAKRINVPVDEVKHVIKVFYGRFKKLAAYVDEQKEQAVMTGQSTTPLGRIRSLQALIDIEGEASAERKGINTPIQGTASDIMLVIMNTVFQEVETRKLQSGPIFGVHDSSLYDVHPGELAFMSGAVQEGFHALNRTPLAQLPLWKDLPIIGEFILGPNWATIESTNEENYAPALTIGCSSHDK